MPWSAITDAEVMDEFTPQEMATLKAIQGTKTQLANILQRVVNSVRGSVLAGGGRIGPDLTIPDQLRPDVIDIARWRLLTAYPQLKILQTEGRKSAYDDAQKKMSKVAAGDVRVQLPAGGEALDTQAPGNAVQASSGGRNFTRTKMNGLT